MIRRSVVETVDVVVQMAARDKDISIAVIVEIHKSISPCDRPDRAFSGTRDA